MFTPPNRSYDATNECKGMYEVHYDLPAIGGCSGWKSVGDNVKYETKKKTFKRICYD